MATKPATGVTTDVALVVVDDPDRPDYVSRGGHKLAGRSLCSASSGLGGRPTLPRRGRVHGRLHRRPAPPRRGAGAGDRRGLRPAGLVAAPGRPRGGARPHQHPRADHGAHRGARRCRRRRSLVHLPRAGPRRPDRGDPGRWRPGPDGQATVRGRQGQRRQGRRGPRPRVACLGRHRGRRRGGPAWVGCACGHHQPVARSLGQRRVLRLAPARAGDPRRRRDRGRGTPYRPLGEPSEKVDP